MGLYDTIRFKCPFCGMEHFAQSKSGECALGEYDSTAVPLDVALDANRHSPTRCDCGKLLAFDTSVIPKLQTISLPIIEIKD